MSQRMKIPQQIFRFHLRSKYFSSQHAGYCRYEIGKFTSIPHLYSSLHPYLLQEESITTTTVRAIDERQQQQIVALPFA